MFRNLVALRVTYREVCFYSSIGIWLLCLGRRPLCTNDDTITLTSCRLYHCVENTRQFHEADPQFIEIEAEHAEVVENLIQAYPNYLSLEMLQTKDLDIIQTLWENKLLLTRMPLAGDEYD